MNRSICISSAHILTSINSSQIAISTKLRYYFPRIEMSIQDFKCESCHELGQSSYILDCGHVKCSVCLQNSSVDPSNEFSLCGECNKKNVRTTSNFQKQNFLHCKVDLLMNVMENFNQKNSKTKCFLCIENETHKPDFFCLDTNHYFCKPHFERHNWNNDHMFLSKEEILDENFTLFQSRRDPEPMCTKHPNRHASYFCSDENKFVCPMCEREHVSHELVSVFEAMETTRSTLEAENRSVEECRNELKVRSQNLEKKSDFEKQEFEDRERSVQECYCEKIKKLERERNESLAKLNSEYKLKSNQLEEEKQENEMSLQTMYRFENISKLCLQILSSSEQIIHRAEIQELLSNVHNKSEPKRKPTLVKPKVNEKSPVCDRKSHTENIKSPPMNRKSSTRPKHVYTPSVITNTITCPKDAKLLSDITIDNNNNIYVADCSNKSILMYNEAGKLVKRFLLHDNRTISLCTSILNICYFSERIIFTISDPNKAFELRLRDETVNELVERFLFMSGRPFIKPVGMATSADKKSLYICDQSDNQIHIMNEKLKKEGSIPNIPGPVGITVGAKATLFILSSTSKIFVLENMCVKNSIELLGAHIEYIATNSLNQILISDTTRHSVVVYSKEGEKMKVFVGCGVEERLSHPVGLAVDGNGRLVVAEMGSKQIKVYSDLF